MMYKLRALFCLFLSIALPLTVYSQKDSVPLAAGVNYKVNFRGLQDIDTLTSVKDSSSVVALQKNPPRSINALHYIAMNDIPKMLKAMKAFGYFDAKISVEMEQGPSALEVAFLIDPGARYSITSYSINSVPCDTKAPLNLNITPDQLGLPIASPAIASKILSSEGLLLSQLSDKGYPLAHIEKRDVFVDTIDKTVSVDVCVNSGKLAHFGPTSVVGVTTVDPSVVIKKLRWNEGDIFSPKAIEETQIRLLKSDLFSSVLITNSDTLDENDALPLKVHLSESKHKNVSAGVSYATVDGFGINFGWLNRNFRGLGDFLSLDLEAAQWSDLGRITYKKIDFRQLDQDLVFQGQAQRENLRHVYLAFSYSAIGRIDKRWGEHSLFSYGLQGEYVDVKHSANNGKFDLISLPIFVKHSDTNNLLNPSRGYSVVYKLSPYANVAHDKDPFLYQTLILCNYLPLTHNEKIVFATRFQVGSIIGPSVFKIPLTKLFLGGSDDDLRGYRYRTVSPKYIRHKPVGGRGVIYLNLESRFRVTEHIGIVPFFDLGCLTLKQYPDVTEKWFKSVGIGLRYFSFFAPIRLDVAFPLDKATRTPKFRIYVSIGQAF